MKQILAIKMRDVKLPPTCLHFVMAHELVHLKIPNHSPGYWRMLGRVVLDWERWLERLIKTDI